MENIEDKLKNYRLRKRRQEQIHRFKESIKGFFMLGVKSKNENERPDKTTVIIHDSEPDDYLPKALNSSSDVDVYNDSDDVAVLSEEEAVQNNSAVESVDSDSRIFKYTLRIVYIAFWVTLYIIAIELQFGIVFLMLSALIGIYLNTRTGPKNTNEISAYSVFNKNCESIDGTLKAEQFEREIGIR
ncbi:SAYSvFN domain-containing protein 1 [Calliphora vicina]|uniref:SAYSvFN domain-containing protein 1 n=1 Tax=Calliphora vicina TaxID=7373 RepID=UPI00325A67A4